MLVQVIVYERHVKWIKTTFWQDILIYFYEVAEKREQRERKRKRSAATGQRALPHFEFVQHVLVVWFWGWPACGIRTFWCNIC